MTSSDSCVENGIDVTADGIRKRCDSARQSTSVVEAMLPPCRICSEKASGFHYGANTCEACKAFFRRSLRHGLEYKCPGNEDCVIESGRRNACPSCRLKKCLQVGMSTSAIKTGRYTHAKKAQYITEVKLLLAEKQREKALTDDTDNGQENTHDVSSLNSPENSQNVSSPNSPNITNELSSMHDASPVNGSMNIHNSVPFTVVQPTDEVMHIEVLSQSSVLAVSDMNRIIEHITSVHLSQTPLTPDFVASLPEREKHYFEQKALKQQMFGPMKPLTDDEYNNVFSATGIDIDGRRELLQNSFIPNIEACVKRFVVFVKAIPGFTDLPLADQIALVKASRYDVHMILGQRSFNPALRLHHTLKGEVLSFDEMCKFNGDPTLMESVFESQARLQNLHLTDEENCLLAAFTVMSTDRCSLQDPHVVQRCQTILLECLLHLFANNHAEDSLFIARVVAVLVRMRTEAEAQSRAEERFIIEWRDKLDFPPIFFEMGS